MIGVCMCSSAMLMCSLDVCDRECFFCSHSDYIGFENEWLVWCTESVSLLHLIKGPNAFMHLLRLLSKVRSVWDSRYKNQGIPAKNPVKKISCCVGFNFPAVLCF